MFVQVFSKYADNAEYRFSICIVKRANIRVCLCALTKLGTKCAHIYSNIHTCTHTSSIHVRNYPNLLAIPSVSIVAIHTRAVERFLIVRLWSKMWARYNRAKSRFAVQKWSDYSLIKAIIHVSCVALQT